MQMNFFVSVTEKCFVLVLAYLKRWVILNSRLQFACFVVGLPYANLQCKLLHSNERK